jgi:hypothetical protein
VRERRKVFELLGQLVRERRKVFELLGQCCQDNIKINDKDKERTHGKEELF